ncbi:MAG: 8-amino-7-oxononanoate synthase [Planctomycetes bacterium]|nr:8-amino-7-oxononanoate synthase [Planctomycetota bacterium]
MDKFDFLDERLTDLREKHLFRGLNTIESADDGLVRFMGCDSPKVLFCSNDYLDIAADKRVKEAVCQAVGKYGYGASSSRLICGTHKLHLGVEEAFAGLLACESALLFNSGWTANEAVLKTLPQKGDLVLLDRYDHASIIDAAKSSEAKFHTFRRDDLSRLERFLSNEAYNRKYIVTESVFSMDGDRADLQKLVELKNAYGAILIVDEAHAVGCFGPNGAGLIEELGLSAQVDIIIAPLGKAFGAGGAIVAAQKNVIDYLINKARPFIYTTAPPPVNCAAIMAALDIIKTEPARRKKLAENAQYLRAELTKAGFDTGPSSTHIVPVIIGDAERTMRVSTELFEMGYFACAIRPPTVANDSSRLRISLQCSHTAEQIDGLVNALRVVLSA